MDSLPDELLIQIASSLYSEPASIKNIDHVVSTDFLTCNAPLKSLSYVSWRWRRVVIDLLFQYVRITLDYSVWIQLDRGALDEMREREFATTLSGHDLRIYEGLCEEYKHTQNNSAEDCYILRRIPECDVFPKLLDFTVRLPQLPNSFKQFSHFIKLHSRGEKVGSVAVQTTFDMDRQFPPYKDGYAIQKLDLQINHQVNEIWGRIFDLLEPLRVVIVA